MTFSPYRQLVDAWLDAHCPFLSGYGLGLDVGGARMRGRWRPSMRQRWTVIDVDGGPLVDLLCDVRALPPSWNDKFDVVKATDVLYLLPDDAEFARAVTAMQRVLRPGGLMLLTMPWLRPPTDAEDRWRAWPDKAEPLGGWWSLLAHTMYDRSGRMGRRLWSALAPLCRRLDRPEKRWALGWAMAGRKEA